MSLMTALARITSRGRSKYSSVAQSLLTARRRRRKKFEKMNNSLAGVHDVEVVDRIVLEASNCVSLADMFELKKREKESPALACPSTEQWIRVGLNIHCSRFLRSNN